MHNSASAAPVIEAPNSSRLDAYDDPGEYWRVAADIVERGEDNDPDVLSCDRPSDGARIYWDGTRRAIVMRVHA